FLGVRSRGEALTGGGKILGDGFQLTHGFGLVEGVDAFLVLHRGETTLGQRLPEPFGHLVPIRIGGSAVLGLHDDGSPCSIREVSCATTLQGSVVSHLRVSGSFPGSSRRIRFPAPAFVPQTYEGGMIAAWAATWARRTAASWSRSASVRTAIWWGLRPLLPRGSASATTVPSRTA